jgi:methylglyoxal synthase
MNSILNHHALIKTAKVGLKVARKVARKVAPKEHHPKAGSAQIAAVAAKVVRK